MEKIRQVSELDPDATPRLLAELQETPPKFWPATAEQFRASLAYKQQLTAREKSAHAKLEAEKTALALEPGASKTGRDSSASEVSAERTPPPTDPPAVVLASVHDAAPISAVAGRAVHEIAQTAPPAQAAHPAADWRTLLGESIREMELRAAPTPASTAEIHEHAIARMLHLAAGETERALEPIPGLSPDEQDYWSRQLFALATYLDHHAQPDDKRRSAAAAAHLDAAVSSLREIGALTLRNMTFCKKIYAYGAYEPFASARFSPGQPIALYVEVENYRSRETDKGYVTSLGSSYEILDDQGQRIAGDAFPDVNDTCRGRRRDFHIQYGITLPKRIATGKYHLQLVVRDRQGDKVGTASLAFEVVGETPRSDWLKESNEQAPGGPTDVH